MLRGWLLSRRLLCSDALPGLPPHPLLQQDHNFLTASFPVYRLPVYTRRLVNAGYKVGVVRQVRQLGMQSTLAMQVHALLAAPWHVDSHQSFAYENPCPRPACVPGILLGASKTQAPQLLASHASWRCSPMCSLELQIESAALKAQSSTRSAPFERKLTALYTAATLDAAQRAEKIGARPCCRRKRAARRPCRVPACHAGVSVACFDGLQWRLLWLRGVMHTCARVHAYFHERKCLPHAHTHTLAHAHVHMHAHTNTRVHAKGLVGGRGIWLPSHLG